ncbi:sodium/potassium/calcium exchanger 4-like isoform X2 [Zootermopsis nevadensis]|uniref:sodium/potassium/calcium exchanger 4-like isoform X2 n=1 Tax=Zootermopsis nevadensis TaxID=136037 RepID=UPI000B8EB229|nr:sodium/potassium/calcium exchanger 4-like isoform X2 [Zootermopsis nevadensis]
MFLCRQLLWHSEDIATLGAAQNCTPPAINDFPPDLFTPEQRQAGAVAIHAIICCYLFMCLGVLCDDYFVPCIQKMCKHMNMSEDVAGATFMAAVVSSPDLFINVVGTFITEGDIGVGTVVGSAVFNVLAVPACCGLFAKQVIKVNWRSLSRDCGIYSVAVIALIAALWDDRIEWYEALILVLLYSLYILAMYYYVEIGHWLSGSCCKQHRHGYKQIPGNAIMTETSPLIAQYVHGSKLVTFEVTHQVHENGYAKHNGDVESMENTIITIDKEIPEHTIGLCSWPSNDSCCSKLWWLLIRPLAILLAATIPNCHSEFCKRFYMVTFFMCIIWIGTTSYLIAWMITVIGDTLKIPDSVMGLTFLAAGMSVPEAVSSMIVTNQGHGNMGISNSIGSNTFDILLCLGLPWLIKCVFLPAVEGQHYIQINSGGMAYSAVSLFSTLFLLYAAFFFNDFKLDYKVGVVCLFMYVVFLIMATLIELNTFFLVNLPVCGQGY